MSNLMWCCLCSPSLRTDDAEWTPPLDSSVPRLDRVGGVGLHGVLPTLVCFPQSKGDDVLRRLERVPVYSLGSSRLEKGSMADKAFRAQNVSLFHAS